MMSDLFEKMVSSGVKFQVNTPYVGEVIKFSNTSGKWFALTLEEIISVLEDIKVNIDAYRNAGNYVEKPHRHLFERTLSNDVARALAGTQSLALFILLGKTIHYSVHDSPYKYKSMNFDLAAINAAIETLHKMQTIGKPVNPSKSLGVRLQGGQNRIYYGAPGTGKSYSVDKEASGGTVFRTVFHPDMQNSDFFGTLKPVTSDAGKISYAFSPGPFSKALAYAYANPGVAVWLVVEELNRAPAAAVFGDLFLLLDRDSNGTGEYDVDCPSEEAARWYKDNASIDDGKLCLPSNLWIVATMNSADQGVYPLDTAFRRRWQQSYIPLDYSMGPDADITVVHGKEKTLMGMAWLNFVGKLNAFLAGHADISEDRLVGPWFVNYYEFYTAVNLPGKLLIYLWDDLFRTHGRDIIFDTARLKTYGDISKAVENDQQIFSDALIAALTA